MLERAVKMASQRPLTNEDGEVREWTDENFAQTVPFSALPADLQALLSSEDRIVISNEDTAESR